jgi:glycosyltransferase involved in cell wall biosynthesis
MKIGILGTRGIPNHYGGFEQFAEYLAAGLVERGAAVWVYNSHDHPYTESQWKGVNIIRCYDPEARTGIAGQFIYDLNCIRDSRTRNFDILLQLGYTSNSVWHRLLPRSPRILTNMDGLEWKRSKYSPAVRRFLKYAEGLAVKSSDLLIADSVAIRDYLKAEYGRDSVFIPYGATIPETSNPEILDRYGLEAGNYFLLIARMQSDNHIEEIIRGVLASGTKHPLLVIGNTGNPHGKSLRQQYESTQIRFPGGIYDLEVLNALRHYSRMYFHGHSAGGTNPSLLEAMAAGALICAHDNPFNRSVLNDDGIYFLQDTDIARHIQEPPGVEQVEGIRRNNLRRIETHYRWDRIIDDYFREFEKIIGK